MQALEQRKYNIIKKIFETDKNEVLDLIENILSVKNNQIYTTKGDFLSEEDYKNHLNKIIKNSDNGAKGFTTNEGKAKIKRI